MIEQSTLKLIAIIIKKKLEEGLICMPYIASNRQLVEILTKGLPRVNFEGLLIKLGMIDIHASCTNLRESIEESESLMEIGSAILGN